MHVHVCLLDSWEILNWGQWAHKAYGDTANAGECKMRNVRNRVWYAARKKTQMVPSWNVELCKSASNFETPANNDGWWEWWSGMFPLTENPILLVSEKLHHSSPCLAESHCFQVTLLCKIMVRSDDLCRDKVTCSFLLHITFCFSSFCYSCQVHVPVWTMCQSPVSLV